MVVFEAVSGWDSFHAAMARAANGLIPNTEQPSPVVGGMRVTQIVED